MSAVFVTLSSPRRDDSGSSRSLRSLGANRGKEFGLVTEGELDRSARVFVAGHRGLVGSAVLRHLRQAGFRDIVVRTSGELDLRDARLVEAFFAQERPAAVVLAAARVGGILANVTYPADLLSDNLRIQVNVLDAAVHHGTARLLFLGSSCIYPRL